MSPEIWAAKMDDHLNRFSELIQRVRSGSDEAARELFDSYAQHVVRAVRRRLSPRMRARYDSADFAQAVWASFFAGLPKIRTFQRPDVLVAYLTRMATNKVVDEYRHLRTEKSDGRRERRMSEDACSAAAVRSPPTPSQIAMAHERMETLAEGQPPHYRRMLELRAEGETCKDIAARLDVDERTVRRVLHMFAERAASHD